MAELLLCSRRMNKLLAAAPLLVLSLSLSLLSTTALAEDVPMTPPPPPPPGAVSALEGQLVRVGDQNQYVYSHKRWNVSTNPVAWILGSFGLSVSYALGDHVALRGDLNLINFDGLSGYEAGIGLPLYFRRTYSGLFLEPGLVMRNLDHHSGDVLGPQVLVGWHWTWDGGFNVAVAAGVGRNWAESEDGYDDFETDLEIFPNGYLRFGYSW